MTLAASGTGSRSRSFELPSTGWLVGLAVAVALPVALVVLILGLRGPLPQWKRRPGGGLLTWLAFVVLISAVILLVQDRIRTRQADETRAPTTAQGEITDPDTAPPPPASGGDIAAIVGVLAAGAVLAILVARRLTASRPRSARDAHELDPDLAAGPISEVLDDAIAALRTETDPRRAVIGAYARMEQTLAHHGLPRHRAESPLEYLARVLERLPVSAGTAAHLTHLFERALFSTHAFGRAAQDDAIDALVAVRDELRVPV